MRVLNPWVVGVAIALFGAGLGGCSLALDFDCAEDGDCANLEGGFVCSGGACVEGSRACSDPLPENVCSDILGPSGADAAERAARFLENRDQFVLISVHPPHGGFAGQARNSIETTVKLALDEINESGGIAPAGKSLAIMVCEDGASTAGRGVTAGLHAVECGAVAMIGANDVDPTLDLYKQVARLSNVPLISPGATSPAVPDVRTENGTVDNDDLLWRVKVPGDVTARATGELVKLLDSHADVRVLYREGDKYGEEMYDALREGLCQNGTFCSAAGRVDAFTYPDTSSQIADAIDGYLSAPAQSDTDLVITLHSQLEGLLEALKGIELSGLQPDVITVEGARSEQAALAFQSAVGAAAALPVACRTVGVSSGTTGPGRGAWNVELNLAGITQEQIFAPTAAFVDATFVTAFAMVSAASNNNGEITTAGILNGLKLLSDRGNPSRDVPVHDWASGLSLLTSGRDATMNYLGASGGVDFDNATNDVVNQRTEIWRYRLGNGQIGQATVLEVSANSPLTDDETGVVDPSVIDGLALDPALDQACIAHPSSSGLIPAPEMME